MKINKWVSGIYRLTHNRISIRLRLTLLICILLLCVIVSFSWTSYVNVREAAVNGGAERLRSLATQLSTMFQQSSQSLSKTTRATAQHEAIKKYIQFPGDESRKGALEQIQKLRKDSQSVFVSVLDSQKISVLGSGNENIGARINIRNELKHFSSTKDSCTLGKMYLLNDSIYYPIIAKITDQNGIIGYMVRWKLITATPKAIAQLSQLLGSGTTLYFGNDDGKLWTDMIRPVLNPPMDTVGKGNIMMYHRKKGSPVMGLIQAVPGTHWVILVELPKQKILAAAYRFLYWLIGMGAGLLVVGILLAWLLSYSISQPLKKLTDAASDIASGNFSLVAEVERKDELGKLARAFNAMAGKVQDAQRNLENKVIERTVQLESANKELEAFSYSVSHDLRAPLRAISGYSTILKEDYEPILDTEASRIIDSILSNAKVMGQLIDDLIAFSRMGKKVASLHSVDMKNLAETCSRELMENVKGKYRLHIDPLPNCQGDKGILKQVWMNLIGNALKYSSRQFEPRIEIGAAGDDHSYIYYVRDNGVGFDMKYADKLFGVFQRLHSQKEFDGTGIGLALVKRIINKHDGEVWAESSPGKGASFYFTIPKSV